MDQNKALEDLAFIKNVIKESKQSVVFGLDFIVWGILISAALLSTYFLVITELYSYIQWLWVVTIFGGWIFSGIHNRLEKQNCEAKTFIDIVIGRLWMAAGISATMIGLLGMFFVNFGHNGHNISPLISSVMAIAYFTTGELIRMKLWRYLAAGWWLSALIMFIFPGIHNIFIMAGTLIFLQVIPGIYLRITINNPKQEA